jgi:hypothetical protein
MRIGEKVLVPIRGLTLEAIIIDDCYRQTENRCTMLVKFVDNPSMEIEINVEDVRPYGQDV